MSHRSTSSSFALRVTAASTVLALSLPPVAHAATNAGAAVVGTGTPASCTPAALVAAVTTGGQITFNCGAAPHTIVVTSTLSLPNNAVLDGGGLITLDGTDPLSTSVQANPLINSGTFASTTIRGITVTNAGVGVRATGRIVLDRVALRKNAQYGLQTGSLTSTGSGFITLIDSAVAENGAGGVQVGYGGTITVSRTSIHNNSGTGLTLDQLSKAGIRDSVIYSNTTTASGAAGGVTSNGPIEFTNVSVFGNSGASYGGLALATTTYARLNNVTLSNNTGGSAHELFLRPSIDGVRVSMSHATFVNAGTTTTTTKLIDIAPPSFTTVTLVLTNSAISGVGPDVCAGVIESSGGNFASDASCNLTQSTDQTGADARLGPLRFADDALPAHVPAYNSPLVDRGIPGCSPTDARGTTRPQGPACDIGAIERQPGLPVLDGTLASGPPTDSVVDSGTLVTVTAVITNAGLGSADSAVHSLTMAGSPLIVSISPTATSNTTNTIAWSLPLIAPDEVLTYSVVLRMQAAPIVITQQLTATNATSITLSAPITIRVTQRLLYLPVTLRR
jgi:hypothetical protein